MRSLIFIISLLLLTTTALAEPLNIPHTFTAGTTAKSAEVNGNFNAVKNAINSFDGANIQPETIKRGALARESILPENRGRGNTIRAAFGTGTTGTLMTVPSGKTFVMTDIVVDTNVFYTGGPFYSRYWVEIFGSTQGQVLKVNLPLTTVLSASPYANGNQIHFEAGIPFASGETISFSGLKEIDTEMTSENVQVTITGFEF